MFVALGVIAVNSLRITGYFIHNKLNEKTIHINTHIMYSTVE